MKKIFQSLLAITIFSVVFSCKKNTDLENENEIFSKKVEVYLNSQKQNNTVNRNERIDLLIKSINFNTMQKVDIGNGKAQFFYRLTKPTYTVKGAKEQVVQLIVENNTIKNAFTLLVNQADVANPELYKAIATSSGSYSGKIDITTVYDKFIVRANYSDGKRVATGILRQKNADVETNSNQGVNSTCIDWYIITTYYLANGTSYTTSEFYATTCGCNNPLNESLGCDIDGGGDGTNAYCSSSEQEFISLTSDCTSGSPISNSIGEYSNNGEIIKTFNWLVGESSSFEVKANTTMKIKRTPVSGTNAWTTNISYLNTPVPVLTHKNSVIVCTWNCDAGQRDFILDNDTYTARGFSKASGTVKSRYNYVLYPLSPAICKLLEKTDNISNNCTIETN